MIKKILFLGIILGFLQAALYAAVFESSAQRATVIELFTSEGCSSCPPADSWLRNLRSQSKLWKTYVPIGFHVDYWDNGGWKDPFSSPAFTHRQGRYIDVWRKGKTVFTPCFVTNGLPFFQWNRARSLPIFNGSPGVLRIDAQGAGRYRVTFNPEKPATERLEAHLVLLGFDIVSEVRNGENAGKKLAHDFVVLQHTTAPMDGNITPTVALNLNPSDARAKKLGVAAWVSKVNYPEPIQATGGYLE